MSRSVPTDAALRRLHVNNARDLASACSTIAPGRVFRCANPLSASEGDIALLRDELGVTELLDLRTNFEWRADGLSALADSADVWRVQRQSDSTVKMEPVQQSMTSEASSIRLHRVSIQEWRMYTRAFVLRLPLHRSLPIAFWLVVGLLLAWKVPVPQVRQRVIREANREGLLGMYKTILDAFRPEICAAMKVVAAAAVAGQPLAMYCKLGKDRTGLIAMLVLSCCGATDDEIVADYARSGGAHNVAKLVSSPKLGGLDVTLFSRAPLEVMRDTLAYLRITHGCVPAYLQACGFDRAAQAQLARDLTPATSPV
ncbi:hypothetical protein WJX81_003552 [Elliptochloris bilobata]|uniref:Tyrosine specific protein phosphatases domain-containing protein n=1 Tax=Elliptochloris bilobata TaxID=381761 RepID=A0AAW1R2K7_9CHLO